MYTDHLASRVQHVKDKAAPAFLDLFNHRLTDLYVQASWFYNLPLQYELNRKKDSYLLSLRALARQPKKITAIDSLIAYAGTIAPGRLTADQLAHVLSHFLDSAVSVQQFVPEWFDLPVTEQTALGGQHATLGLSAFCGARAVQFDSKIRIVFHQLDDKRYLRLLPAGDMYQVIIDFIRKWCGCVWRLKCSWNWISNILRRCLYLKVILAAWGEVVFWYRSLLMRITMTPLCVTNSVNDHDDLEAVYQNTLYINPMTIISKSIRMLKEESYESVKSCDYPFESELPTECLQQAARLCIDKGHR